MKKLVEFIKEHGSLIFKFWVDQVVWSVVGLMASWPLSILWDGNKNYTLYMALVGVFTAGVFCFRMYDLLNQFGLKYSIRKNNPSYVSTTVPSDSFGLKIAAIAYAPTALLILLYAVFFFIGFDGGKAVMLSIIYIIPVHSMYNAGFLALSETNEIWRILYSVLSLAPVTVLAWLGYYLGVRDKGVLFREKASKE